MRTMKRGEVYWCENHYAVGSEMQGIRPCVIVSNDINNENSDNVQVVMLTTAQKRWIPTHVTVLTKGRMGLALCETVTTVTKEALGDHICNLADYEMKAIDRGLKIQLSLEDYGGES